MEDEMSVASRFMACVRADAVVRDIQEGRSLAGQAIDYANHLVNGGMVDIEQVSTDRLRADEEHGADTLAKEYLDWMYSVTLHDELIKGGPKPSWVDE